MEEILNNVNWMAVVIGAVVSYLVGWLWYSPKFLGNMWAEGVGIKMDKNMEGAGKAMFAQAVWTFLLAWVIGVMAVNDALATTALIVIAMISFNKASGFFTKKSHAAIAIESGYIFVMAAIMVATHALL